MRKEISNCHEAEVLVGGDEGETRYYICTQCKQACDLKYPKRPSVDEFFADGNSAHTQYITSPDLFKYVQALDNYIDYLEDRSEALFDGNCNKDIKFSLEIEKQAQKNDAFVKWVSANANNPLSDNWVYKDNKQMMNLSDLKKIYEEELFKDWCDSENWIYNEQLNSWYKKRTGFHTQDVAPRFTTEEVREKYKKDDE